MSRLLLLAICFVSTLMASRPLDNNNWVDASTQDAQTQFEYTLQKVASFEIQLIRISTINKTKPTPTVYTVSVIRTDTMESIPLNTTYGFFHVPSPFNKSAMSNDEILNFTSRGGLKYRINITHPHDIFNYTIRACYGGCSNTKIAPCLIETQVGESRMSCSGNGACMRGEECVCDHINWQIQLAELPPSLRWIAEFLGKADTLFNKIMWADKCDPRPDATKVIENLKLSLVIFITVVLATIILIIGLIIGICCCCCRGRCCCSKKAEQTNYSPLSQMEDYDLDAAVDKFEDEK